MPLFGDVGFINISSLFNPGSVNKGPAANPNPNAFREMKDEEYTVDIRNRPNPVVRYAPDIARPMIADWEQFRETAYVDNSQPSKPYVYGFGFEYKPDGTRVKPGDRISRQDAELMLTKKLEKDNEVLGKKFPGWKALDEYQKAAYLDIYYNTLQSNFLNGKYPKVYKELMKEKPDLSVLRSELPTWRMARDTSSALGGLETRRRDTVALWDMSSNPEQVYVPRAMRPRK